MVSVGRPGVDELHLRVEHGRPPKGWVGAPGIRGLAAVSVQPRGADGSEVTLRLTEPVDPALLLAAAVRMLRPLADDVGPVISAAPGLPTRAAALAPGLHDVWLPGQPVNRHLRRCDVLVVPAEPDRAESDLAGPDCDRTVVIEPVAGTHAWVVDGRPAEVLVDPTVHRPIGRRSTVAGRVGTAALGLGSDRSPANTLVITGERLDLRIHGDLASGDVHRLRELDGLVVPVDLPAHWRMQLQACGLVLAEQAADLPDSDLDWQAASVDARRAALREHGPQAALDAWPSVSVVLVTHRERFIDHAVEQLSRLAYPRLQFVIGLHGVEVEDERFARLRERAEVVVVRLDAGLAFGAAMQQACQRADGVLLAKVDDDDCYAPTHLWDLVIARAYSGAQLVGKALDWIYVEPEQVTVFRPAYPAEQYATFIAGGTMLISRTDLDAVGGWRPVPRSIDRGLIDRVRADGGLVYRTHGLGYLYVRRGEGHTALARDAHFLTKVARQWPGLLAHEAFGTGARP